MTDQFKEDALEYHRSPTPGKIAIAPTKPLANQRDLGLAYSPGVGYACMAIVDDPKEASNLTARANLVGVITNGTAVLGLGAIGPLASKPVMEGKAVLFKKFAGIDVFDIEVDELDPDRFVDIVASLEPTFGGINLEDIKAPECFEIEKKLRERMKIPVFHDDQHGTAIIVSAAVINGLRLVGKKIEDVKIVVSGAGAAALACLDLLVAMGLQKQNIYLSDIEGVVYKGREKLMDNYKGIYAQDTKARTLADIIDGADIFLGLSAPKILTQDMVKQMADKPLIFALANPVPEILPEEVKAVRSDAIIATGRTDYPNQVNNVLCFPFIFRGALDVGATGINQEMKIACVKALADLTMAESSDVVSEAYGGELHKFGQDYIIPKPFDPRLITELSCATAKAAMDSGVATRPIKDFDQYRHKLEQHVFRSGLFMKPIVERAKAEPRRLVYAEGEDPRVLQAVQVVVDEKMARPILIGRPEVIEQRIEKLSLRLKVDADYEVVNPESDPRYFQYWSLYHRIMERNGVSPDLARTIARTNTTVIAALMLKRGEADALLCGLVDRYANHLQHIKDIIGLQPGVGNPAALNAIITHNGVYFLCDTYVNQNPTAGQIAEMAVQASKVVKRFGTEPKVALLSHSSFGSVNSDSACKMRDALSIIKRIDPELQVEGEMHADAAICPEIRKIVMPHSRFEGVANLLVMPNLDSSNISFNLLKVVADGLSIGPLLLGVAGAAHIMTPSAAVRGIINMSALAVVDAQGHADTSLNVVRDLFEEA